MAGHSAIAILYKPITGVDGPTVPVNNFNRQFKLGYQEKGMKEYGDTMFHIVNTHTRAAQLEGYLSAELACSALNCFAK